MHSGTGFDELYGFNVSGNSLDDMAPKEKCDIFNWYYRNIMEHPCGGQSSESLTKKSGDVFHLNFLHLPLRKDNGDRAIATIADVRGQSIKSVVPNPNRDLIEHHSLIYADFIDVGFGVPSEGYAG